MGDLGKLKPETFDVLRVVKEYGLILCTGHLSPNEIYVLAREALRLGIEKILVMHPCGVKVGPTLFLTQQKELAEMECYMEHCFISAMSMNDRLGPTLLFEVIRHVGADRCVMATNFGQPYNLPPKERLRLFIVVLCRLGISEDEIYTMTVTNPTKL